MSANPTLSCQIRNCNEQIDDRLSHIGMSLRTYKFLKAFTQLLGASAGVYAMSLGADPMTAFALIAIIISGPEAMEYLISQQDS